MLHKGAHSLYKPVLEQHAMQSGALLDKQDTSPLLHGVSCRCNALFSEKDELPVLILKPQAQVLKLSHEVLQLLAQGCRDGCARSLTGRASLTSLGQSLAYSLCLACYATCSH